MDKRDRIRIALRVISGRSGPSDLSTADFEALGYDSYKFGYYGKPDRYELMNRCEDIILDAVAPIEAETASPDIVAAWGEAMRREKE